MWIVYAFLAVQDVVRRGRFPFKLPWWGLVFPNVRMYFSVIAISFNEFFTGRVCESYYQPLSYF